MKTKHLLLLLTALLGIAFICPTDAYAQKKKKKKKKEFVWELPELSGNETIDEYLLSCDTLYNNIRTYSESLAHYQYEEVNFTVDSKNYSLKYMRDTLTNRYLSYGMGRWQVAQGITAGTTIVLEATTLSLQTASAALALPELGLKAIKYFKPVKDLGPHVIGLGIKEIGELKKVCQETMRKYTNAKKTAYTDETLPAAVKTYLMTAWGMDEEKFLKQYYKYFFVCDYAPEADTEVVEKTEEEKAADIAALKDTGTVPEDADKEKAGEADDLLSEEELTAAL